MILLLLLIYNINYILIQQQTTNMDIHQWVDVTPQLTAIHTSMSLLDIIKSDQLTLQDCMQAQEINDQKMDPKFDISSQHTIKYKLQHQLIKLPQQLTIYQIAHLIANIFQLQACTLQGQPLSSSIYTFSYLYDRKICQNTPLFNAIIQSIHTIGSHVFDLIKQAGTVKEDDVTISVFSFSNNKKSHDQVSQLILQAEKKFQAQFKKNQDKVSYNFILNSLRLRRSIHAFAKVSGISFDPKNMKKIQADIQSTKKKIAALQQIKFVPKQGLLPGVFLNDLHKTLKVHFGPRPVKLLTLEQAFQQIKNSLQQIQLFFPIPTKISQMKNKIQILQRKPYNGWGKSYIKANIFAKQNYYFSIVNSEQALTADIDDWIHLKGEAIRQNQKFVNLIKTGTSVINQTLYRMLGNSMRWQWECSKIYEDYNILIHMANQVDSSIAVGDREFYISSWFYYYGLQLMSQQLLVGFQNNLYQKNQLKYVLFVIENILGVIGRNSQLFLKKIDKTVLPSFNDKNFNKKIKKKLNDDQMRMFTNIIFKKGLHNYFRALFNIITILHARKLLENKFEIKNRFRIFKNVLFTKIIDYKQYKHTIEEIAKRETDFLTQALGELKEVKNIFTLFTAQVDDNQTFFRQKQDAQALIKLSVKASIIVMTLKMNATANKKFGVDLSGRFPEFTMQ